MTQTVSFTSSAESTPAANDHRPQERARRRDRPQDRAQLAQRKNPASPRYADRIIIPSRSPSVSPFTAAPASDGESTPAATISTAPRSAAAGRSSERNGSRPAATARYVSAKTATAASTGPCTTPPGGPPAARDRDRHARRRPLDSPACPTRSRSCSTAARARAAARSCGPRSRSRRSPASPSPSTRIRANRDKAGPAPAAPRGGARGRPAVRRASSSGDEVGSARLEFRPRRARSAGRLDVRHRHRRLDAAPVPDGLLAARARGRPPPRSRCAAARTRTTRRASTTSRSCGRPRSRGSASGSSSRCRRRGSTPRAAASSPRAIEPAPPDAAARPPPPRHAAGRGGRLDGGRARLRRRRAAGGARAARGSATPASPRRRSASRCRRARSKGGHVLVVSTFERGRAGHGAVQRARALAGADRGRRGGRLPRAYLEGGAAVDRHLGDQLLLPAALLAAGLVPPPPGVVPATRYTVDAVTKHLTTNADVIRRFLDVEIADRRARGRGGRGPGAAARRRRRGRPDPAGGALGGEASGFRRQASADAPFDVVPEARGPTTPSASSGRTPRARTAPRRRATGRAGSRAAAGRSRGSCRRSPRRS